ncbi:MAG: hypothetical protein HYU67_04570 [Flavobacteriia bacterium]|nr:hypothetical protein [Flavobacteriia bacterium]
MSEILKHGKRSYALNFNQNEIDEINEKINHFNLKSERNFTNIKELFIALLDFQLENKNISVENIVDNNDTIEQSSEIKSDDLQEKLANEMNHFIMIYPEMEGENIEIILKSALEKASNPQVIEVEVEKIVEKEVEKADQENENILKVECSDVEKRILEIVATNRNQKGEKPKRTIEQQLHDLAFAKSTLKNYGGGYYTGL